MALRCWSLMSAASTERPTGPGARARAPGDSPCARAVPHSVLDQLGKPLQVKRPAALGGNRLALALPALAVAVEVAVLELDPGPLRPVGDEAHLDLAGLG